MIGKLGMPIVDFLLNMEKPLFASKSLSCCQELLASLVPVISTGGGIVLNPDNRKLLQANPCNIYLKIDFETLYDRIKKDQDHQRPLFLTNNQEDFKVLFEKRLPLYEEVATHIIDITDKTPEEIVEIIRCL